MDCCIDKWMLFLEKTIHLLQAQFGPYSYTIMESQYYSYICFYNLFQLCMCVQYFVFGRLKGHFRPEVVLVIF